MSCRDEIPPGALPGGITITTSAICSGKKCHVDGSGQDHHEVVFTNCGTVPYEFLITGRWQTTDAEYDGLGATWTTPPIIAPGRPGRSRPHPMKPRQRIVSTSPGQTPIVHTEVQNGGVGRPKVSGTMAFQVDTV